MTTTHTAIDRLYEYFGWQGGTIHQLASATGLSSDDILKLRPEVPESIADPYIYGISAMATCGANWRRDVLAPKWKTAPLSARRRYYAGVMFGTR